MSYRMRIFIHRLLILSLVGFPLLGVVLAMVLLWRTYVFPSDIALFLGFYVVTALGVTAGYHRMLTHQSFRCPEWLRGLILIFGAMSFEGPPMSWAATHIKHHAHSDEDGDPHSPLDGFWHAHLGWMLSSDDWPSVATYAPQLLTDKTVLFVDRYTLVWMGISLLLPLLLGGWTGFLWGGLVRIFVTTHVTWSVNSVCHTFGKREFETTDESRNEWVVGLIGLGEGWHNNHHAFPTNAFHGLRWWQFDLSGLLIRTLEALGLAWDVQRVSPEVQKAHKSRSQMMRDAVSDLRATVAVSIVSAKKEIGDLGNAVLASAFTDAQREQFRHFQQQATERLDTLLHAVSRSANLKRQRLVQYQKEVQQLLQNCKQHLGLVVGDYAVV